MAEAQPDRIRDAIRFNPDTGEFTVRLYRPPNAAERNKGLTDPIEQSISVSQEDIRYNIRREVAAPSTIAVIALEGSAAVLEGRRMALFSSPLPLAAPLLTLVSSPLQLAAPSEALAITGIESGRDNPGA